MNRSFILCGLVLVACLVGSVLGKRSIHTSRIPFSSFSLPETNDTIAQDPRISQEEISAHPWEQQHTGKKTTPITKDFFRCRGSSLSPPIPTCKQGKVVENLFDCHGPMAHSLPIKDKKEFVYPILLELLNELQIVLRAPVVITSGHRCPTHNTYVDQSPRNQSSKHQIGAEVSFYILGFEHAPEQVLNVLFHFYSSHPRYATDAQAYHFERYEKETDVATKPWCNKEIMIKLYQPTEGRNGDNKHVFPYFSIQVRHDRETDTPVIFSWKEAQQLHRK